MADTRIILSGIWVALMLSYLLGDVLRIFSGDAKPGEIEGKPMTQGMLLGMAALMIIPVVMVVLTLILNYSITRWANIIAASFFLIFNLASIHTYPSAYDKFLNVVGLVFNIMTVWYAWNWI